MTSSSKEPLAPQPFKPAKFGQAIDDFAQALAGNGPVPAAGSAAAAVVAQGAALGVLAVRVSLGKAVGQEHLDMRAALSHLEEVATSAVQSIDEDAEAVRGMMRAARSKDKDPTQSLPDTDISALNSALVGVSLLAAKGLRALDVALPNIHENLIAEVGVASALLHAGARSAALIVKINTGTAGSAYRNAVAKRQRETAAEIERLFEKIWRAADGRTLT